VASGGRVRSFRGMSQAAEHGARGPRKRHTAPYRADLLQEPEKQNVNQDTPFADVCKRLVAGERPYSQR